jgi:hypothetical protein
MKGLLTGSAFPQGGAIVNKWTPSLPEKAEGFTKRSSAVLRCKPYRSTYIHIRLAGQFLRALHLNIFEQPKT